MKSDVLTSVFETIYHTQHITWREPGEPIMVVLQWLGKYFYGKDYFAERATEELIEFIGGRIYPYKDLGAWVQFEVLNGAIPIPDDVSKFRMRWLLHLIEQYQLKGE